MTVLRGPVDADRHRIKVDRYNDRWPTDPLPACEPAPASDRQAPTPAYTERIGRQPITHTPKEAT